ncbi:MAG: hypothetical protein PT119_18600 [Aphanizomenon gracile PMC627.10]|nr:hypothetical protein [Aphanizomenon gracile PMC627.10]
MSDPCLGMLGCDCLKLGWLCAIAVWGCWESDRLKLGVVCDRCLGISWESDSEALRRNRLKLGEL